MTLQEMYKKYRRQVQYYNRQLKNLGLYGATTEPLSFDEFVNKWAAENVPF